MKHSSLLPLLLGVFVLVGTVAVWKWWQTPTGLRGLATKGGRPFSVRINVEHYSQTDGRWRDEKLGPSEGSLAHYGCTVCATAMALTTQGYSVDPSQLNRLLWQNSGFTDSGLLIWRGIDRITAGRYSVDVIDGPTFHVLDDQLEKGNPLVAKVLYEGRIWHWVLISGKEGMDYLIHDPLGTRPHARMTDYPNGIFAVRYLVRNEDGS